MVDEARLSVVLAEFASALASSSPARTILQTLVERVVGVLPVTAAGVTLVPVRTEPAQVAASDDTTLRLEREQAEAGQGPGFLAHRSGQVVLVPDLSEDDRFPTYAAAASDVGVAAVFSFPLGHGDGRLGALDLHRGTPGPLRPEDVAAAQTLADVAAAYVLNARTREEARGTPPRSGHLALHDELTGLPNRTLLRARIEHASRRARRTRAHAALLVVDLDRLTRVNDVHGHRVGDELLVAVGRRLSAVVRPGDTVARVSGGEFVLLCDDMDSAVDAEALTRRIHLAFAAPFQLSGTQVRISASVGTAFAGPGEAVSERLVTEADVAMHQAKGRPRRRGGGRQVLDLREVVQLGEAHTLERDLRDALRQDDLQVAYQPIVSSADGTVVGLEALLRWTHAQRGAVTARAMVDVAEQSGLILDIGAWVLSRTCRDLRAWARLHRGTPLTVCVNVSARQVMAPDFPETVAQVLATTGTDASELVLEITESILIEDSDRAMAVLDGLRALGVRLALDDFGTGYSSLRYLHRLPISIVKIDGSFVADIDDAAPKGGAIVAAVSALARTLGLTVVAEGVESRRQGEEVRRMGCDLAQGFYYAPPLAAAEVEDLLHRSPADAVRLPADQDAVSGAR